MNNTNIIPKNTNILHKQTLKLSDDVVSNLGIPLVCSGYGQTYTTNPEVKNHVSSYASISYDRIKALVDNPQAVDKSKAQWLIPSTLMTRTFKEQESDGEYWYLWTDQDENPPTIDELATLLFVHLGCNYEAYASKSAKLNYQKGRSIIPLDKPLTGEKWKLSQECLNDWLESNGIAPDRATQNSAQVCYLPNKGEFYTSQSERDSNYFDPLEFFKVEIEAKKLAIEGSQLEIAQKREAAKLKRGQRKAIGFGSKIDEFKNAYLVEDILIQKNYDQRGDKFRHPNSESGSYSASVKDGRVHSLSSSDPLYTSGQNGTGAHDSFSAFTVLEHNGDRNAALKDAGDNYLFIGKESWNAVKQRENANKEAKVDTFKLLGITPESTVVPFDFNKFSLNGDSAAMKAQMLTDTYVLGEIAILGQLTAFYAKPNSGKTLLTLYLLIESIKAGNIKAEDVYYINADDNYKGLVHKLELAEKHGFQMIAPGFKDFDTASFGFYLTQLMATDEAKGKVIILDTLKKFTNIMDKKVASEFGKLIRMFVTNGGTVIMLAHTNKNRDAEGKVVFSGTSDIVDDVDCAYTLDVNDDKTTNIDRIVLFENIKSRGDVAQEAAYKYAAQASHYEALLDSVKPADEGEAQVARERARIDILLTKNEDLIEIIIDIIEGGTILKTELINKAIDQSGESKAKVRNALKEHTGKKFIDGHRWEEYKGEKSAKMYKVIAHSDINLKEFMARGYQETKNDEW